ncbi:MAG: Trk system potassium transporter TrkA [Candidatus Gastranaerophilales bacterium]|nr:Trk system potassium transporter TrkA [Candidatus Gastranaerophilales bacterium]
MKIILFGATEISYLIAHELYEKHDVTLIADEENLPENFAKLDISFVSGNAACVSVLEAAEIKKADVFIACTALDEVNIVSSWTAKKISNVQTVSFVSKNEYINNIASQKESLYQSEFGIDHIIWPEELLTQEILRIITVPEALDVEFFAGGKARLFEYRIKENSLIENKLIKDCFFPEGSLIVGITRDEELFIPDGSTKLLTGDKAIFMGTESALNILGRNFFQEEKNVETATIIGGGSVGYMLAENLEKIGIKTKIIELNPQRGEFLSDKLKNTLILCGDGTNIELLESENIGDSDVLVSVTNNDEKNLLCSLLAKQLGIKKVITRVNKPSNINLFEKVGIDVAVSPKGSALKEVRDRILEKDVSILAIVEQGQGEVLEITAPDKFKNTEIKDIKLPAKAIIGAIRRGYKVLIPKGNTLIREDDNMIIFTTADQAQKIKEYFTK